MTGVRDRRYEPRQTVYEPVEVGWAEAAGQVFPGVVRDVSRSGARIELDRPIRLETLVQITLRDQTVTARVSSCARSRNGFLLGLELDAAGRGLLTRPRRTPPD